MTALSRFARRLKADFYAVCGDTGKAEAVAIDAALEALQQGVRTTIENAASCPATASPKIRGPRNFSYRNQVYVEGFVTDLFAPGAALSRPAQQRIQAALDLMSIDAQRAGLSATPFIDEKGVLCTMKEDAPVDFSAPRFGIHLTK